MSVSVTRVFTGFANVTSRVTGRPLTFAVCIALIVIWAVSGPLFQFSDTWQLVINTSTTIITFLMVFLIQNTQNRDNAAIQAKLDELIRVSRGKNGFIGIERLTDKELEQILEDFEEHAEPLPLGEKAEYLQGKVRAVQVRKAKARSEPKAAPRAKTATRTQRTRASKTTAKRPAKRKAS